MAQPASQPAALYSPPGAGKLVVDEGAVVSTSQVKEAGVPSVFPA